MKLILLSGGSGKRLWPLSNNQRSKQFIKVLRHEDHLESMVQRVWRQLTALGLKNDTYIATGANQATILKDQLGINDDQIITEPTRRDTFPAIALATSYLSSKVHADLDETVVILPVDPYVDVEFFNRIKDLDTLLNASHATLGLIGIAPTVPSEKYGYIVPKQLDSIEVKEFKEKPNQLLAKQLISEGAMWNAGVFGFKLTTMHDTLEELNISTDFDYLVEHYETLPKNSFDYEFVEKQQNIVFNRYEGYWKDLGTWNTLTEEMGAKTVGFTSELIDTENTFVVNETAIPVAVIGTKDLIVAAGPEGILVSSKEESPRVKELPASYFESIHFSEADWGHYHSLLDNEQVNINLYHVLDNKTFVKQLADNQKVSQAGGQGIIKEHAGQVEVSGIKDFNFLIITEK
ncbi:MAG: mannose-1-phosphate guanylyltransferase [Lactobacillaceae bacterium]|jgi:mannose-1-phosphate guanylyltransferase|nr:mannose-1-phosphate guanylyltransferase [Lactobacillaceae bacterium]